MRRSIPLMMMYDIHVEPAPAGLAQHKDWEQRERASLALSSCNKIYESGIDLPSKKRISQSVELFQKCMRA